MKKPYHTDTKSRDMTGSAEESDRVPSGLGHNPNSPSADWVVSRAGVFVPWW